jgi:prepilin-type N-terminal cleavage/methylation domain-containing protein
MKRRAFTLIELLTTIAIIAILIAMLMPVMLKAKGKVFQFTASSSARQLGMALNLYLSEADSYFPVPHWAGPGDPQDLNMDGVSEWYEKLMLYIENPKILRVNADTTDPQKRPCSFVVNSWFDYVIPESMVKDPSDTIYLTERELGYPYDFIEWWRWQEGIWPPEPEKTTWHPRVTWWPEAPSDIPDRERM